MKKTMKSLALNKQTVARLNNEEMKKNKGGFTVIIRCETREICSDMLSCHPYC